MKPMPKPMKTQSVLSLALFLAPLLIAGCRVGPPYIKPAALPEAPPTAYKETTTPPVDPGQWKPAQPQDAMLRGKWWDLQRLGVE